MPGKELTMIQYTTAINDWLWSPPMMFLILGAGVFFTLVTRGVQFRRMGEMLRLMVRGKKRTADIGVTSFQTFMVSAAGRVGTGNIAGVATAITFGGPGSIFWMWVVALIGGATSFVECTLAQIYKVKGFKGDEFRGGPSYYITKGLGCRPAGVLFSVVALFATAFCLHLPNISTLVDSVESAFHVPRLATTLVVMVIFAAIVFGGIKSIGRWAEIMVPFMSVFYVLSCCVIIALHLDQLPAALVLIVKSAFNLEAGFGSLIGMAVIWGVKRGIYSNEAGQGNATHTAGSADVDHPCQEGLTQALAVYFDTLLICTVGALMMIVTGSFNIVGPDGTALVTNLAGIEPGVLYAQKAIDASFAGFGSPIIAICVCFFCFTSIMATYYYAETNMVFLFGDRTATPMMITKIAVLFAILYGGLTYSALVWSIVDIGLGLMSWVNIIAILLLIKPVLLALKDYEAQQRQGVTRLTFRPEQLGIKGAENDLWAELSARPDSAEFPQDAPNVMEVAETGQQPR